MVNIVRRKSHDFCYMLTCHSKSFTAFQIGVRPMCTFIAATVLPDNRVALAA